jgi:uncharacterized protein (TIGR00159 family)
MIEFGIKDIIDIFSVALLLYYLYKLMRGSGTLNIFYGVLIFIVTWIFVTQIMEMKLLGSIFDKLVSVGVLALIILFQDELRRFFFSVGSNNQMNAIIQFFSRRSHSSADANPAVMQIVRACAYMSKNYVGALIIFERNMSLSDITNSGELIDANINAQLIKNIFFKNSPLHDGAMVISNNRIRAAACILPVSHSTNIPKDMGLRHRAALGITQQSDALAIIVSEETGRITLAHKGTFTYDLNQEELERSVTEALSAK